MNTAIREVEINSDSQKLIQELYIAFASKPLAYTRKNYTISEDDAMNLVYKTIFRMADVHDRYSFENEHKRNAFVFKILPCVLQPVLSGIGVVVNKCENLSFGVLYG